MLAIKTPRRQHRVKVFDLFVVAFHSVMLSDSCNLLAVQDGRVSLDKGMVVHVVGGVVSLEPHLFNW